MMFDPSKESSRFSGKVLWIVLILAGVFVGVWWPLLRHHPIRETAQAGDVKRSPDGRVLYFDGRDWTTTPLPPQDTPF